MLPVRKDIIEIARNLRSTPSTVSNAIDKLIALGLIEEQEVEEIRIDAEKGHMVEGK